jgi:WD40 repeat protein
MKLLGRLEDAYKAAASLESLTSPSSALAAANARYSPETARPSADDLLQLVIAFRLAGGLRLGSLRYGSPGFMDVIGALNPLKTVKDGITENREINRKRDEARRLDEREREKQAMRHEEAMTRESRASEQQQQRHALEVAQLQLEAESLRFSMTNGLLDRLPPEQQSVAAAELLQRLMGDTAAIANDGRVDEARMLQQSGNATPLQVGDAVPVVFRPAVAIAPDGTWLVATSEDGAARIWGADGALRATLTSDDGPVHAVAIARTGTWLATGSEGGTVRTWGADGALRTALPSDDGSVQAVAIAPDERWLVATSEEYAARIWDLTGAPSGSDLIGDDDNLVYTVAIAPDGSWLATTGEEPRVGIWRADGVLRATLPSDDGPVHALAIAPDGTWLATASIDGTIRTWGADGALRAILPSHGKPVHALTIAPDGTWLVTIDGDGSARIWGADGVLRATLIGDGPAHALAIAPDGRRFATASGDGAVRIWSSDGLSRTQIVRLDETISGIAWSFRGNVLCIAGARRLYRVTL